MRAKSMMAFMLICLFFMSVLVVSFAPKTSWLNIPYRDVETHNLTFTVEAGKYYEVNFYLRSGYTVNFSFSYSGPLFITVYLMDSENYKKYEKGDHFDPLRTINAFPGKTYEENYTAMRDDRYYLVFENILISNAVVNLTVNLEVLKFLPVPYRT